MRATLLLLALGTGALAMSDTALADEKKDAKKEYRSPAQKESYTEKVTLRPKSGAEFLNPIKDVPAFSQEIDGKTVWYVLQRTNREVRPGGEITDAKGNVWVIKDALQNGFNFRWHRLELEAKPKGPAKNP